MIEAEHKLEFKITNNRPDFNLTGDQWGVCCEDFGKTYVLIMIISNNQFPYISYNL